MNNHYLFNVQYYDYLFEDTPNYKETKYLNNLLLKTTLNGSDHFSYPKTIGSHSCSMSVVYPGILIGIGNPHMAGNTKTSKKEESNDKERNDEKSNQEEIKAGITLDYTTGLPYIPGSSIKGAIRSVFKQPGEKGKKETEGHYQQRCEAYHSRLEYVRTRIHDVCPDKCVLTEEVLMKLEKEIFASSEMGQGDVFYDAFPVKGGPQGKLFAFENITPHEDFKEPQTFRMLKLLPGVVFDFRFRIMNSKVIPALTADKKLELFKIFISDFGLGAKTNLGFGMLEEKNNRSDDETQEDDDSVEASVVGYNEKKTVAYLSAGNQKASLFFKNVSGAKYGKIDEILHKNDKVRIRYIGKDDKGYDQWKFVEFIPRPKTT